MKLIGRFARENNVTIKALHHYEKVGLIIPSKIDQSNGYRYYDDSTVEILDRIKILKDLGFSLNEIKVILIEKFDLNTFKDQLKQKEIQSSLEVSASREKHNLIINFMKSLEKFETNIDFKEVIMLEKECVNGENGDVIAADGRREFSRMADAMFENTGKDRKTVCGLKVDLDDFAKVNEDYGYAVGDVVIKEAANIISSVVYKGDRKNYSVYERSGGDEFSILCQTSLENAKKIAEEIIDLISKIDFGEVADDLAITTTIGISTLDVMPNTKVVNRISYLLMDASVALFELKKKRIQGEYLVFTEK